MSLRHSLLGKNTRRVFARFLKEFKCDGHTDLRPFRHSDLPRRRCRHRQCRIHDEQTKFLAAVDAAVIAVASDDRAAVQSLSGSQLQTRMAELENIAATTSTRTTMRAAKSPSTSISPARP